MGRYIRSTFGALPMFTRFKLAPTDTAKEFLKFSPFCARSRGRSIPVSFRAYSGVYVELVHGLEMLGKGLTNV